MANPNDLEDKLETYKFNVLETLGITAETGYETAKRAYRSKSKELHPDKDPITKEMEKELKDILKKQDADRNDRSYDNRRNELEIELNKRREPFQNLTDAWDIFKDKEQDFGKLKEKVSQFYSDKKVDIDTDYKKIDVAAVEERRRAKCAKASYDIEHLFDHLNPAISEFEDYEAAYKTLDGLVKTQDPTIVQNITENEIFLRYGSKEKANGFAQKSKWAAGQLEIMTKPDRIEENSYWNFEILKDQTLSYVEIVKPHSDEFIAEMGESISSANKRKVRTKEAVGKIIKSDKGQDFLFKKKQQLLFNIEYPDENHPRIHQETGRILYNIYSLKELIAEDKEQTIPLSKLAKYCKDLDEPVLAARLSMQIPREMALDFVDARIYKLEQFVSKYIQDVMFPDDSLRAEKFFVGCRERAKHFAKKQYLIQQICDEDTNLIGESDEEIRKSISLTSRGRELSDRIEAVKYWDSYIGLEKTDIQAEINQYEKEGYESERKIQGSKILTEVKREKEKLKKKEKSQKDRKEISDLIVDYGAIAVGFGIGYGLTGNPGVGAATGFIGNYAVNPVKKYLSTKLSSEGMQEFKENFYRGLKRFREVNMNWKGALYIVPPTALGILFASIGLGDFIMHYGVEAIHRFIGLGGLIPKVGPLFSNVAGAIHAVQTGYESLPVISKPFSNFLVGFAMCASAGKISSIIGMPWNWPILPIHWAYNFAKRPYEEHKFVQKGIYKREDEIRLQQKVNAELKKKGLTQDEH